MPKSEMLKAMSIDQGDFDKFQDWRERTDRMKTDYDWLMQNLLVWNEEYPEDERGVLDETGTFTKLQEFLDIYAREVRGETLQWVATHLFDRLEQHLDEEPPGVDMKDVATFLGAEYGWVGGEVVETEDDQ